MKSKKEIVEILTTKLTYVYCDTCSDKNLRHSEKCDDCNRKRMKWSLSKITAEELADQILN